jgi:hypothetical protein
VFFRVDGAITRPHSSPLTLTGPLSRVHPELARGQGDGGAARPAQGADQLDRETNVVSARYRVGLG